MADTVKGWARAAGRRPGRGAVVATVLLVALLGTVGLLRAARSGPPASEHLSATAEYLPGRAADVYLPGHRVHAAHDHAAAEQLVAVLLHHRVGLTGEQRLVDLQVVVHQHRAVRHHLRPGVAAPPRRPQRGSWVRSSCSCPSRTAWARGALTTLSLSRVCLARSS